MAKATLEWKRCSNGWTGWTASPQEGGHYTITPVSRFFQLTCNYRGDLTDLFDFWSLAAAQEAAEEHWEEWNRQADERKKRA